MSKASTARLLLAAALPALLCGCGSLREAAFPRPDFKIVSVKLTRLSLADATFECIVDIINKSDKEWTARNFQTGIYVNDKVVGVGVKKEVESVPANSSRRVSVTVTATFQDILRTVDVYRRKEVKEVPFHLKGTLELWSAVGMIPVDFVANGTIPVPRLPKVALKDVKVKNIGLVRYLILFAFNVSNPNVFEMGIDQLSYDLYVSDELVARGSLTRRWVLPASKDAKLEIPVETKISKIARAIRLSVESGRLDYHLKGKIVFTSLLGKTDFPIEKKGYLDIGQPEPEKDEGKQKGKDKHKDKHKDNKATGKNGK